MAIAFRSENKTQSYYAGPGIVVTKPTGVVDGDLLIAFVAGSCSTPAGWTLLGGATGTGSSGIIRCFYKIAASEGASFTFTESAAGTYDAYASVVAYTGCDPTTPIDPVDFTIAAHLSTTNFTTASITGNAHQVMVGMAQEYTFSSGGAVATTWTVTGATSRAGTNTVNTTEEVSYKWCDSNGLIPGGSISQTFTASQTSSGGVSGIILLNPALNAPKNMQQAVSRSNFY